MARDLPVPAADRTLQILELLLRRGQPTSIQDFLSQLDISRSSLYALLQTLKAMGYVEKSGGRGLYQPGPRLLAYTHPSPIEPQDLLTAFYQEAIDPPLGETIALVICSQNDLVILAQIEGKHRVRSVFEPGQRLPAASSAAGPVLQSAPLPSVSEQGYDISSDEDTVELALPICRDGSHPDAALLISAPGFRCHPDNLREQLPALREIAARLSYRLGAQIYSPYQTSPRPPISSTIAMSPNEIADFLQGPWAARLACIRPDGTPHVVPVWHEWNKKAFYVAAWPDSRWADYLLANPRVSLTIDEPWPPLRRISVWGEAQLVEPEDLPGGQNAFLTRLFQRYLGRSLPADSTAWHSHTFRIIPEDQSGYRGLQMVRAHEH